MPWHETRTAEIVQGLERLFGGLLAVKARLGEEAFAQADPCEIEVALGLGLASARLQPARGASYTTVPSSSTCWMNGRPSARMHVNSSGV